MSAPGKRPIEPPPEKPKKTPKKGKARQMAESYAQDVPIDPATMLSPTTLDAMLVATNPDAARMRHALGRHLTFQPTPPNAAATHHVGEPNSNSSAGCVYTTAEDQAQMLADLKAATAYEEPQSAGGQEAAASSSAPLTRAEKASMAKELFK